MKIFKDLLFSFMLILICIIIASIVTSIVYADDSLTPEEAPINEKITL